jgi:urease accessory protein
MDASGPRLRDLFQRGSAKVRFTRTAYGNPFENAVLINTAGGVTGGDRIDWDVEIDENASCTVISQACEKVYRSDGDMAIVDVRMSIAEGGRLDWLPQETILFHEARLARSFTINLADSAEFLAVEAVILGRAAMGECISKAYLSDVWRIRRNNRLVFADAFKLDEDVDTLKAQPALLQGAGAYALVLLLAQDAEQRLETVRTILACAGAEARAGASAFDGKLVCKIAALDGVSLRKALIPIMTALRDGVPPPRLWTI